VERDASIDLLQKLVVNAHECHALDAGLYPGEIFVDTLVKGKSCIWPMQDLFLIGGKDDLVLISQTADFFFAS